MTQSQQTTQHANGSARPATTAIVPEGPRAAIALYAREQIDTIKQTVARGATDAQLALFLEVCRSRGLDPFTRQVHWTPNGVIVGIDGFRAIADRTERYVPGPTTYETDAKGTLVAAHVTVKKFVAGQWWDLTESAYLSEYQSSTPIWKQKPRVMLAKCAEARALRRAFPAELSGIYAPEEMDAAEPRERDVTPPSDRGPQSYREAAAQAPTPEQVVVEKSPAPPAKKAPEPVVVESTATPAHDPNTGEVHGASTNVVIDGVTLTAEEASVVVDIDAAKTADDIKRVAKTVTDCKYSSNSTRELVKARYYAKRQQITGKPPPAMKAGA